VIVSLGKGKKATKEGGKFADLILYGTELIVANGNRLFAPHVIVFLFTLGLGAGVNIMEGWNDV